MPDMQSKLDAQIMGLGVGYLPQHLAEAHVARGQLVIKRVAESKPEVMSYIAWCSNGGKAHVRNVTLPAGISHVIAPVSADLPENAAWRAWIETYSPESKVPPPAGSPDNIGWAADVWWTIKKYWVIEAQRYIRATRSNPRSTVATTVE